MAVLPIPTRPSTHAGPGRLRAVRPFRGLEVHGVAELVEGDATASRVAIARRYLGAGDDERFAAERRSWPEVLLRLVPDSPGVWDLSGILPR